MQYTIELIDFGGKIILNFPIRLSTTVTGIEISFELYNKTKTFASGRR